MSIERCKHCTMAVDTDNITMEEHDADCVCQEGNEKICEVCEKEYSQKSYYDKGICKTCYENAWKVIELSGVLRHKPSK